jgi:hypothetical protein
MFDSCPKDLSLNKIARLNDIRKIGDVSL